MLLYLLLHISTLIHAVESAPPSSINGLVYILAAVAGGGALTGIVGLIRLKKTGAVEKEEIISKASEQAVNAMHLSLSRLEEELEKTKDERGLLEKMITQGVASRQELEGKVRELNARIETIEKSIVGFKSKESFIRTMSSSYDGVFLLKEPEGIIIYANPAAHIQLGYSAQSLVNRTFADLVPEDVRPLYDAIKGDFLTHPVSQFINDKIPNFSLCKVSNEKLSTLLRITPLENDMVLMVAREIH